MDAMYIVITDENRTVGIEQDVEMPHVPDVTLEKMLADSKFRYVPGTVKVNSVSVMDDVLKLPIPTIHRMALSGRPYTNRMRIVCKTPKDDPSKLTGKQLAELKAKRKQTVSEATA